LLPPKGHHPPPFEDSEFDEALELVLPASNIVPSPDPKLSSAAILDADGTALEDMSSSMSELPPPFEEPVPLLVEGGAKMCPPPIVGGAVGSATPAAA